VLDIALKFLTDELNDYLERRLGSPTMRKVVASALVDDKGSWVLPDNQIGLSLIAVDEERTVREQLPHYTDVDKRQVALHPPLRLNLTVLIAARFAVYDQALGFLSHVLTFFQANSLFTAETHARLDARIEKLALELISYGSEQLSQTWTCLGAKYLPSAIYRVRAIALQDSEPQGVAPPITSIVTTLLETTPPS
jgi:hypothetical protein